MSHLYRVTVHLIIFLLVFSIVSFIAHADVVLNEVAVQPNQVVELYNTASTSADISSWYIDDAGGTTYFTIPLQTFLAPKSCILFSSDFNFNKSSADIIRLFDNSSPPTSSSAKVIEQYSYAKAPDTNYSFSKKIDGGTEWQTVASSLGLFNESLLSCIPSPTPTPNPTETPTSLPSPTPYSLTPTSSPVDYQNIFISEVYPYPLSGEQEWVEIYNGNNTQVNLDHWYIDDTENGGSTPKSFSLILDPYMYGVVTLTSSLFNNDGDTVRLLDSNKNEKDSMEYGKISQGISIARISFLEDSFCEQEPSKNSINTSCILEPTQISLSTTVNNKTIASTQKIIVPTKKALSSFSQQKNANNSQINPSENAVSKQGGVVLGTQTKEMQEISPAPYFSVVSFSYSLLTIVSVFIKMRNA